MRFQQCMKGLFANRSFLKSVNNSAMYIVANLFICMISSRGGGGEGVGVSEIMRFWEMKLIIRTRREIRFLISCSIVKSEIQIS